MGNVNKCNVEVFRFLSCDWKCCNIEKQSVVITHVKKINSNKFLRLVINNRICHFKQFLYVS